MYSKMQGHTRVEIGEMVCVNVGKVLEPAMLNESGIHVKPEKRGLGFQKITFNQL